MGEQGVEGEGGGGLSGIRDGSDEKTCNRIGRAISSFINSSFISIVVFLSVFFLLVNPIR